MSKVLTAPDPVPGRKYVPVSKSVGCAIDHPECVLATAKIVNQSFLFYLGTFDKKHCFGLNRGVDPIHGDFFLPSDVVEYVEPEQEVNQDAIEFAEWVSENKYIKFVEGWYNGKEKYTHYSSTELYQLFKQSKK